MTEWKRETVAYILKYGNANMCSEQEKLYDVIDMTKVKDDVEELSYQDEIHSMAFKSFDTGENSFFAYLGIKHLLLEPCHYYSCTCIIIYDKVSSSYVKIEVDESRIVRRFRQNMYVSLKSLVFQELYKHYYAKDVNFDEELL